MEDMEATYFKGMLSGVSFEVENARYQSSIDSRIHLKDSKLITIDYYNSPISAKEDLRS